MSKINTIRKITYRDYPVPAIILEGKFLKNYGFFLGDRFEVEYQYGKIIIKAIFNHLPF